MTCPFRYCEPDNLDSICISQGSLLSETSYMNVLDALMVWHSMVSFKFLFQSLIADRITLSFQTINLSPNKTLQVKA